MKGEGKYLHLQCTQSQICIKNKNAHCRHHLFGPKVSTLEHKRSDYKPKTLVAERTPKGNKLLIKKQGAHCQIKKFVLQLRYIGAKEYFQLLGDFTLLKYTKIIDKERTFKMSHTLQDTAKCYIFQPQGGRCQ